MIAAAISSPPSTDGRPARIAPRPSFGVRPASAILSPYVVEHVGEVGLDDVAEDDRVADLHHRRLEVHRVEHVVGRRLAQRRRRGTRRAPRPRGTWRRRSRRGAPSGPVLSGVTVPSAATCWIVSTSSLGDDDRLLVGLEVVVAERRDAGLRALGERPCCGAGACGRSSSPTAVRGGRCCPRAARGSPRSP